MPLQDFVSRILTMRRFLKAMERLVLAQERQATALERLADKYTPIPLPTPSKDDLRETGPSFGRDADFIAIEAFREKVQAIAHREPTDDELNDHLDGKEVTF